MASPKFPGPYINDTNANDPVMIRVPMDTTGIGSPKQALPRGGVNSDSMMLKHVGGSLGKGE